MFYLKRFFSVAKIRLWFDDEHKVRREQRWNLLTGGKPQYWQHKNILSTLNSSYPRMMKALQYDTRYKDGGQATRFFYRRSARLQKEVIMLERYFCVSITHTIIMKDETASHVFYI